MNVKRQYIRFSVYVEPLMGVCSNQIGYLRQQAIFVVIALFLFTPYAHAFDIASPFYDPLRTLPERIESGVTLPGDSKPATCPVNKDFTTSVTLVDAIDLALCNNPQLKGTWAAIKVQSGAVGEARAAYLPSISGSFNYMFNRSVYPGSTVAATETDGETMSATLGWRLFDFGGRDANRKSANYLLIAAITHHDAMLQKTLADVVQAYFEAHTAKATVQAKEQSEAYAKDTLETAQRRETLGAAAHSDTLQAISALAKASLEKNRAIGVFNKAISVLLYTLGVPTQTHITLSEISRIEESENSKSLKDWLAITAEMHPAILSARALWKSSVYKISSVRSEGLPSVDITANYYQNGYPGQGLSSLQSQISNIGISISFPFFDGFSRTYKIRGAEALAEQHAAELQDTEHNTMMEVVKTFADAESSLQNLQASDSLLNAAQESFSASQRKYSKGVSDILEVLNTQTVLSDAMQEHIRSLSEWHSARLRLLACVGVLGREKVSR